MPNYLYIAGQPDGPIKVGFSASPKQRMRQLRTASSADIRLIECFLVEGSAKILEATVHTALGDTRMAREWFDVDAAYAVKAVNDGASALGVSVTAVDDIVEGESFASKRGRKPNPNAKKLLTLRLDPDVIEHYRATGEGWQSRMNDVLRKAAGL